MTILRNKLACVGLATALTAGLSAAPALAAPPSAPGGVKGAKSQDISSVRYRGHRGYAHRYRHHRYPGFAAGVAGALVGAATAPLWMFGGGPAYYDYGPSYAYSPYAYYGYAPGACVIDEGYGRTRPCDGGGAP